MNCMKINRNYEKFIGKWRKQIVNGKWRKRKSKNGEWQKQTANGKMAAAFNLNRITFNK